MKKIVSIRTKNIWLGIGIFIAFLILQITIAYRLIVIKDTVHQKEKCYKEEIALQKIYNNILNYKLNKSSLKLIRNSVNDLDKKEQNDILTYLYHIENNSNVAQNINKLQAYVKNSLSKLNRNLAGNQSIDITKENIIMFIIILIINILINLALYIFAKRVIANIDSLQNGLKSFFDYLNRESLTPNKLNIHSNDEFEIIANTINKNIEKIEINLKKDIESVEEARKVAQSMSEGDFSYRITSSPANPEIAELKKSLNMFLDEMQKIYSTILSVFDNYKKEDYTSRVELKAKGEIEALIEGVNNLGTSLNDSASLIAKTLTSKSEILQETSNKLTQNVDELSVALSNTNKNIDLATNQIEEIVENIKSTVSQTNEMKNVATKTSQSAQKGKALADDTLNAMQEISESTKDISEAIGIIDSIAFQTNILSLNAAVEAATAGEAGKGFAVVAQEVRNLASKSAEAAKKIKELVGKTQIKSEEGIEISENMKDNFIYVVDNVSNTLKLVNDVAKEADEEMKKILSIDSLIKDVDKMTNDSKNVMQNTYVVTYDLSKISNELYERVKNKKFVSEKES